MRSIGIRREDKDQWEARVPLVPDDVAGLASPGSVELVLQPSARRRVDAGPEGLSYLVIGARVEGETG